MHAPQMICPLHYFCKRSNLLPAKCTEFPRRALAENPFHYLLTNLGVAESLLVVWKFSVHTHICAIKRASHLSP